MFQWCVVETDDVVVDFDPGLLKEDLLAPCQIRLLARCVVDILERGRQSAVLLVIAEVRLHGLHVQDDDVVSEEEVGLAPAHAGLGVVLVRVALMYSQAHPLALGVEVIVLEVVLV